MNLLIVGRGQGSWQMRGQQLGAALGARVTSAPTEADWLWADGVVLVKREAVDGWRRAHTLGLPIVWDALDFWRQPQENTLSEVEARRTLAQAIATIGPTRTIGATQAMATAAGGVYLPHHARIGLTPTPARERFGVIGYDGNPAYLHDWSPAILQHCARRGWTFVVNPPDLTKVDLLVALRGGPWDGWMCRAWKSGVKLVNAICAGRPVITQDSSAMRELQPAGSIVESPADLPDAIEAWIDYRHRQAVVEMSRTRADQFSVEAIAVRYRAMLAGLGIADRSKEAC